jgi:hypothetical protein
MLGLTGSPQAAVAPPLIHGADRGATIRRPAVTIGALLALILAMALLQLANTEHSPFPTAPRHRFAPHQGLLSLPLAAQGVVSATLGADDPAYRVTASGGGFQARNPAQRLRMRFVSAGVQIGQGKTQVGLSLRAMGYGTALHAVDDVRPSANANRVTYRHAGLSEWYRNGPLGLEQGFTIARAPSGHPAGVLTLSMTLSGNVHASRAVGAQSITFSHPGDPSLRYGGLIATDAGGRALHGWLALYRGRIVLRVDTRGARFPLRIDPLIQQGEKLTGGGESVEGSFGWRVALSGNGSTALIGAPSDDDGQGAAWVFTRSGSTWTEREKLTGGEESGKGEFGSSVALSSDGSTALVGGPRDNSGNGAAWVFTRSGETWTQQGEKLTASGRFLEGGFGASVALSSEGNTALIGEFSTYVSYGAVWAFTRSGSIWTPDEKLSPSAEVHDEAVFGISVALSSNGSTALIGGYNDNRGVGAAWVFTRSGATWTEGEKLTGSGESGKGYFGISVALSSDGNTALIGGFIDNDYAGAAWVFTHSGETWTQQGEKLTGGGESGGGEFGTSVALTSEGNTALIGGASDNEFAGAAWVFTRAGETWSQQGEKLTGTGESGTAHFGQSVALSSEGNTALIGGFADNEALGAAWAFAYVPPGPAPTVRKVSPSKGPAAGGTSVAITGTGFTGATAVEFGSTAATSFTINSAKSITAISPEGTTGTVDITVTTPNGTSAVSTKDHFKFEAPTVTSVNPDTGSTAGGTPVTITGTGFALGSTATSVKFGSTPGTSVACTSTTTCTVLDPAHKKAEAVDVRITVNKTTSQKNPPADQFTYH